MGTIGIFFHANERLKRQTCFSVVPLQMHPKIYTKTKNLGNKLDDCEIEFFLINKFLKCIQMQFLYMKCYESATAEKIFGANRSQGYS